MQNLDPSTAHMKFIMLENTLKYKRSHYEYKRLMSLYAATYKLYVVQYLTKY